MVIAEVKGLVLEVADLYLAVIKKEEEKVLLDLQAVPTVLEEDIAEEKGMKKIDMIDMTEVKEIIKIEVIEMKEIETKGMTEKKEIQ